MSRPRFEDRRRPRHADQRYARFPSWPSRGALAIGLCPPRPLRSVNRLGAVGLVLMFVAAIGCDSGPRRYPIHGEVSFDGVAVDTGTIQFHPIDPTKGPLTGGNIEEGRYEVPEEDGPLEGKYRVQIKGLRATGKMRPNLAGEMTVKELVPFTPPEFSGTTSTLRVEIGPDSDPVQDFPLEKK